MRVLLEFNLFLQIFLLLFTLVRALMRGIIIGAIISIGISFYGGAFAFISAGIVHGALTDFTTTKFGK